jgi:hypothetical protein
MTTNAENINCSCTHKNIKQTSRAFYIHLLIYLFIHITDLKFKL